jgi:DNA polymerase III alpha subunit
MPAPDLLAAYAELHCLSNYSFLRGASHPEELVERARGQGYAALALTDECSLASAVRAQMAAKSPLSTVRGSSCSRTTAQAMAIFRNSSRAADAVRRRDRTG